MPLFYIIILAIIQGITEFLPVSSSAHLMLAPYVFGQPDQGYQIDIAVHFGSLFAVMIYFRAEVARLFAGIWDLVRLRFKTDDCQLLLKLAFATIPVVLVGGILSATGWLDALRSPIVIAIAMIGFGLVLYWADTSFSQSRSFDDFNWRDAFIMGLWQAIALIPGTSRSGATVTASRILGFNRTDGAKIAMLMSIPTILAGATLLLKDIATSENGFELGKEALIAATFSFIAAYFALSLMMRFLQTTSYLPYVIYRVVLGIVLLIVFL